MGLIWLGEIPQTDPKLVLDENSYGKIRFRDNWKFSKLFPILGMAFTELFKQQSTNSVN